MKRTTTLFWLTLAFVACDRADDLSSPLEGSFTVSVSSVQVKSLYDGKSIIWERNDKIAVFSDNIPVPCTTSESGSQVSFKGDIEPQDNYYMLYPYDESACLSGSSITTSLPSLQKASSGSFARGANVSVAYSTKTREPNVHSAVFNNAGAYISFEVVSDDSNVSKIIFKSIGNEPLSGTLAIELNPEGLLTVSGGNVDSVAVVPSYGTCFKKGTYYAVVLPCELSKGIKVTVKHSDNTHETYNFDNIASLGRNHITRIVTPFGGNMWNTWTDADSLRSLLAKAVEKGKLYTSQQNYYDYKTKNTINSIRYGTYGGYPLMYGIDFATSTGTYYPESTRTKHLSNILSIVQEAWAENRSIPVCSWHLESPYASSSNPELGGTVMPARFCYQNIDEYPSFPSSHRYQIMEILTNSGTAVTGQKCGDWFDDRVREVAAVINQFVDSEGNPIPIIFRLWHELESWWAWWQVHDTITLSQQYQQFYQLTVDKFRAYCPDAEILWVYCTDKYNSTTTDDYLQYYPGDEYVDIMGYDDYTIGKTYEELEMSITRARVVSAAAKSHGKIAMLCETLRPAEESTLYQDIFFQDFVEPIVADTQTSLSIFQVWGGADNTDLRKSSFKGWYSSDMTIFNK